MYASDRLTLHRGSYLRSSSGATLWDITHVATTRLLSSVVVTTLLLLQLYQRALPVRTGPLCRHGDVSISPTPFIVTTCGQLWSPPVLYPTVSIRNTCIKCIRLPWHFVPGLNTGGGATTLLCS